MTKHKWDKYTDFMDNTPRYSFEGRDPQDTYERFRVVVYCNYVHPHLGMRGERRYFASVYDQARECEWFDNLRYGHKSVMAIKAEAERVFNAMTNDKETLAFKAT